MQESKLILTKNDFQKLSSLVAAAESKAAALLEEELGRASVVPENDLPGDVVAMNSEVSFADLETGKVSDVILVYPHEADIGANKISILTPVGSALIGLRAGQSIEWPFPGGKTKRLKVLEVRHESR